MKAARELGLHLMPEKKLEQRFAFLFRPAFEAGGMADVHVKRTSTGFRMRAHDGMLGDQHLTLGADCAQSVLARP